MTRLVVDRDGPDWQATARWLAQQIDDARAALEDNSLSAGDTSYLRGQIGAWRVLLDAVEPPRSIVTPAVGY